jgi:HAD superfamily hydrolase (TIGR01509 family)
MGDGEQAGAGGHRPSAGASSGTAADLAAVLFDMDGTLLDSERLWDAALRALAAHHGGVLSGTARLAMVGHNSAETMAVFYRDLGISDPDPVADGRFVAGRMAELYATELAWQPGAEALVTEVRAAGVPTALVTSTGRRLVELALDSTLGRDTFDVLVCGNDVSAPKPDPESYRTAAQRLGVPIGRCVAIEDSPTGLASALAAGAVVVGVAGEVPLPAGTGAHLVASLTELDLPLLARLAAPTAAGGARVRHRPAPGT